MLTTDEDKKHANELATEAFHFLMAGKLVVYAPAFLDSPKRARGFEVLGEILLRAFKRGQLSEILHTADTPANTHVEARACREDDGAVLWCGEEEAEYFSVYRGAPGRFHWMADFGLKDDALHYAEFIGVGMTITNRIGEIDARL